MKDTLVFNNQKLDFKIAVAQVSSLKGNIEANTTTHIRAIKAASQSDVSYIVFSELSLTGYEPELAVELAFTTYDDRLRPLINAARQYQICVVAGAPLEAKPLPQTGAIIVSPSGGITVYSKMNLHNGEDMYFSSGNNLVIIECLGQRIANAICADTNAPDHVQAYVQKGATIYTAGVLITTEGYDVDTEKMESYAQKYGILVAMANYNQPTGGWKAIGKSAIWSPAGRLALANETQEALVIAHETPEGWVGELIEI